MERLSLIVVATFAACTSASPRPGGGPAEESPVAQAEKLRARIIADVCKDYADLVYLCGREFEHAGGDYYYRGITPELTAEERAAWGALAERIAAVTPADADAARAKRDWLALALGSPYLDARARDAAEVAFGEASVGLAQKSGSVYDWVGAWAARAPSAGVKADADALFANEFAAKIAAEVERLLAKPDDSAPALRFRMLVHYATLAVPDGVDADVVRKPGRDALARLAPVIEAQLASATRAHRYGEAIDLAELLAAHPGAPPKRVETLRVEAQRFHRAAAERALPTMAWLHRELARAFGAPPSASSPPRPQLGFALAPRVASAPECREAAAAIERRLAPRAARSGGGARVEFAINVAGCGHDAGWVTYAKEPTTCYKTQSSVRAVQSYIAGSGGAMGGWVITGWTGDPGGEIVCSEALGPPNGVTASATLVVRTSLALAANDVVAEQQPRVTGWTSAPGVQIAHGRPSDPRLAVTAVASGIEAAADNLVREAEAAFLAALPTHALRLAQRLAREGREAEADEMMARLITGDRVDYPEQNWFAERFGLSGTWSLTGSVTERRPVFNEPLMTFAAPTRPVFRYDSANLVARARSLLRAPHP